jgi:hypothetical protein
MLKDLNTVDGQRAMRDGKAAELAFYECFKRLPIQWISEDADKVLAGHDFIVDGKRVEVKSNSGWNDQKGIPYETCCVEVETRGGNVVGWKQKKADLVVFINRLTWKAYIYRAFDLKAYSHSKASSLFWKHDARCFTMPWIEESAGFMAEVEL